MGEPHSSCRGTRRKSSGRIRYAFICLVIIHLILLSAFTYQIINVLRDNDTRLQDLEDQVLLLEGRQGALEYKLDFCKPND